MVKLSFRLIYYYAWKRLEEYKHFETPCYMEARGQSDTLEPSLAWLEKPVRTEEGAVWPLEPV